MKICNSKSYSLSCAQARSGIGGWKCGKIQQINLKKKTVMANNEDYPKFHALFQRIIRP